MQRFYGPIGAGAIVFFVGIFVIGFLGLYERMPQIDKVLHVGGGFVAAWLAWTWLADDLLSINAVRRSLIVISIACSIGVTWEIAEFGAGYLRTTAPLIYQYFHGGNLADTLGDLAADALGALAFISLVMRNRTV